ncbi:hypothetical protein V6N13_135151 [Hibiscus sabdariffa]|uniref:4-coumarate--CoA ligase n=1 Tax=Hibiscus sabdariffa TaxID=183260 RepID=A0ABR2R620_9ROSI
METPTPTPMQHSEDEDEHVFLSKYPPVPVPDNLTLPEFVLQDAELYADNVAFVEAVSGKSYTYQQYGIVALGIMAAGGVFSGANPASHPSEIMKQANAANAKLIVTNGEEHIEGATNWDELLEAGDRAGTDTRFMKEEVLQSDLCALPFSSGTTGISKGVMLIHRNLVANLCSSLFSVGPEMIGEVTTLGLIPFFHTYGIAGICCATLRNKGKVVVMIRFDLRTFLNALITQEVTFAPIVPPIILALVKNPIVDEFDLSKLKLRAIMTAAAPLAPELLPSFENKFPGVQVQEAYGLTEHSCITLTHGDPVKGHHTAKKNSVGFILPNLELKFINPDTGRSLPKNTLEVTKRTRRRLIEPSTSMDGYIQVAPAELEAILLTHSSVEDADVVPLPDEEVGEIPAACVVMNPNAKESERDIMDYVASNVAHYKKVRVLQFVDTIPKSPSGKIMRRLLKDKMMEILGKNISNT